MRVGWRFTEAAAESEVAVAGTLCRWIALRVSKLSFQLDGLHVALLVDDQPMSVGYCLDFAELVESAKGPGHYFPLVCGCGSAGCSGLEIPVEVKHEGRLIRWHVQEPEPERWWSFDRTQYRQALYDALQEVIHRSPAGRRATSFAVYGTRRKDYERWRDEMQKQLEGLLCR